MGARVDKDGSSFKMSLKATIILAVVVAVIFMFAGGWIRGAITKFFNPQQELTNEVVVKQLEKIQDLTTAKETDYGFEKYEDGIAFLNKKQFTMFYTYEARAGIDLAKAQIKIDKDSKTVSITLPAPTIQSVVVNPDSLRFFDKSDSFFNAADVEDTKAALDDAKKKTEARLDRTQLLKIANKQAKDVIERLYEPTAEAGMYTVTVTTTNPK
jgi:DNA polymerase III sliding clamp (beta) subunit (PCNA family)